MYGLGTQSFHVGGLTRLEISRIEIPKSMPPRAVHLCTYAARPSFAALSGGGPNLSCNIWCRFFGRAAPGEHHKSGAEVAVLRVLGVRNPHQLGRLFERERKRATRRSNGSSVPSNGNSESGASGRPVPPAPGGRPPLPKSCRIPAPGFESQGPQRRRSLGNRNQSGNGSVSTPTGIESSRVSSSAASAPQVAPPQTPPSFPEAPQDRPAADLEIAPEISRRDTLREMGFSPELTPISSKDGSMGEGQCGGTLAGSWQP